MNAWLVHGWAFGPAMWDALAPRLGLETRRADLGYFGQEGCAPPDEPAVWITHSFGTMHALSYPHEHCRALVAINGFARFVAGDGQPGVAPRVLGRMIAAFGQDPRKVVSDFRRRCAMDAAVEDIDSQALLRDLLQLRDGDCRDAVARLSVPVLSLQGEGDPVLPRELRERALGASPHVHPSAGHVLPIDDAEWCAARIDEFLARVPA